MNLGVLISSAALGAFILDHNMKSWHVTHLSFKPNVSFKDVKISLLYFLLPDYVIKGFDGEKR